MTMDSSEAQRAFGCLGPKDCEPSKKKFATVRKIALGHIAKDENEDGDFEMVHCDVVGSTDEGEDSSAEDDDDDTASDLCESEADSDGDDDDARRFVEEEADGDDVVATKLGPLLGSLSHEILMVHVLICLPVLGRTLCTKAHALLDKELDGGKHHDSDDKTTTPPPKSQTQQQPMQWIPAGTAPRFPLKIKLRRHFSSPQCLDYKLRLRSLHDPAPLEIKQCEEDDEGVESTTWKRRCARELPAERVAQVFREIRALKAKKQNQQELTEPGKKHYEVTVEDALGRMVLKHVYAYSFPRTPVDALLEALLSGSNMAADEEDADDEASEGEAGDL